MLSIKSGGGLKPEGPNAWGSVGALGMELGIGGSSRIYTSPKTNKVCRMTLPTGAPVASGGGCSSVWGILHHFSLFGKCFYPKQHWPFFFFLKMWGQQVCGAMGTSHDQPWNLNAAPFQSQVRHAEPPQFHSQSLMGGLSSEPLCLLHTLHPSAALGQYSTALFFFFYPGSVGVLDPFHSTAYCNTESVEQWSCWTRPKVHAKMPEFCPPCAKALVTIHNITLPCILTSDKSVRWMI